MHKRRLAIVVLNFNKYDDTIKCVRQLLISQKTIHIVVVDNASTNDSYDILKAEFGGEESVDVIVNTHNAGYAAGNNFGFRYAIHKWPDIEFVGIMNPDTLVDEEDIFEKLMDKASMFEDVAVISPVLLTHDNYDIYHSYWDIPTYPEMIKRGYIKYGKRSQSKLVVLPEKCAYVDIVHGSLLLIKKEALLKINYLDEGTFLYGEENILGIELRQAGYREMIDLEHFFHHNHAKKGKATSLKSKLYVPNQALKSREYTCRKYYGKKAYILKVFKVINNIILTFSYAKERIKK
ncbi:Glycosyl transferase family 2 [Pseudobutyrivibrio sp. ACV-2]|uniref:glycosyltransferase family 2 protein n=1 Tax=Pseudobutyrivibrio sp. ACV-2 TaxID=1520801 RepID=UPI000898BCFE|nr:glycosyltransferase family 2 protein [Pseudobutyrivibrio sp. ACV-2]SEA02022.1 Glycosyl transferase family 2 [Pseudobutyrivibrio sp. ACV-2]